MAYSRFRDRSGLVIRNRVIAYLERERRNKNKSPIGPKPTNPTPQTPNYQPFFMTGLMGAAPDPNTSSTNVGISPRYYMMGFMGEAPNREAEPETSLRPVFFMMGLMGVAPNRTVNSVI